MGGFSEKFSLLSVVAMGLALAACDSGGAEKAVAGSSTGKVAAGSSTGNEAPGKNWAARVVATKEHGFLKGNPDASVKIVEFASFTCPHCRDFFLQSENDLDKAYIDTGRVSYEYRPFALNLQDVIAVNLATCEGADRFFTWQGALYHNQDSWVKPYMDMPEADLRRIGNLPPEQQLLALAEAGKFQNFARSRGVSKAKFDSCISNEKQSNQMAADQQAAVDKYKIGGTPTFLLNDKKLDGVTTWPQLKAFIDKALQ